jgi:hypothetical protein
MQIQIFLKLDHFYRDGHTNLPNFSVLKDISKNWGSLRPAVIPWAEAVCNSLADTLEVQMSQALGQSNFFDSQADGGQWLSYCPHSSTQRGRTKAMPLTFTLVLPGCCLVGKTCMTRPVWKGAQEVEES